MTQKSWAWTCVEVGDGGATSFSQEVVMTLFSGLTNTGNPETDGVFYWGSSNTNVFSFLGLGAFTPTGLLKPTNPSGSIVRIANGAGICGGIFYINTSNVDFDVSSVGSGYPNAIDAIVMRRLVGSQTVRLAYVQASGAGLTASLTRTSSVWEVPICYVVLDGGGAYSDIVDARTSANRGQMLIEEQTFFSSSPASRIVFSNVPTLFKEFVIYSALNIGTPTGGATSIYLRINDDRAANTYFYEVNTLGVGSTLGTGIPMLGVVSNTGTGRILINNYGTDRRGHFYNSSLFPTIIGTNVGEFWTGNYIGGSTSSPINTISLEANNYPTGTYPLFGKVALYGVGGLGGA